MIEGVDKSSSMRGIKAVFILAESSFIDTGNRSSFARVFMCLTVEITPAMSAKRLKKPIGKIVRVVPKEDK